MIAPNCWSASDGYKWTRKKCLIFKALNTAGKSSVPSWRSVQTRADNSLSSTDFDSFLMQSAGHLFFHNEEENKGNSPLEPLCRDPGHRVPLPWDFAFFVGKSNMCHSLFIEVPSIKFVQMWFWRSIWSKRIVFINNFFQKKIRRVWWAKTFLLPISMNLLTAACFNKFHVFHKHTLKRGEHHSEIRSHKPYECKYRSFWLNGEL